jgi:lauroyl/myristoyl acyltransferase
MEKLYYDTWMSKYTKEEALMHVQDFFSSKLVTQVGVLIAQHVPRRLGYGLAKMGANMIARRKPEVYWTVRGNLRQIIGQDVNENALHNMTRQVFTHAGQTYYDFFNAIGQPPEILAKAVHIPESLFMHINSGMAQGRGVLLLGMHMSNFDLTILSLGAHGLPIQVLTVADPRAGFRFLNRLRVKAGFEVTPITPESLRAALRRLRNGGVVITAGDRPIPEDRELIGFFGRPAYLPLGPARLAMMSGATILVGGCHYDFQGGYVVDVTGPIEMVRTGDWRRDMLANTGRLSTILEGYVRAHPEQWMMFYPLWPEAPVVSAEGSSPLTTG